MNIYRCTDRQGKVTYRASRKPNDILKHRYDDERLDFAKVEIYESKVGYGYVFNHELPIVICV